MYKSARDTPFRASATVSATARPLIPALPLSPRLIDVQLLDALRYSHSCERKTHCSSPDFLDALGYSHNCENKDALQLLRLQTSLGKTPKTQWENWGKSAVFGRENKCKRDFQAEYHKLPHLENATIVNKQPQPF